MVINLTYLNVLLFFLLSFHFFIAWSKAFKASYALLVFHSWEEVKAQHSILDCELLEVK